MIDKVTREPFYEQNHKKVLLTNKEILNKLKKELSKAGADKSVINLDAIDSLVDTITHFEDQFL